MNPNVLAYYILHRIWLRLLDIQIYDRREDYQAALDLVAEIKNSFVGNIDTRQMQTARGFAEWQDKHEIPAHQMLCPIDYSVTHEEMEAGDELVTR